MLLHGWKNRPACIPETALLHVAAQGVKRNLFVGFLPQSMKHKKKTAHKCGFFIAYLGTQMLQRTVKIDVFVRNET